MEVFIRVKALGKRRDVLAPVPYIVPDGIGSLRALLLAVVQNEVERYNSKEAQAQLIPFLTEQEIADRGETGKVSFGRIYSDKKADPDKAVRNAIQCFEDGLVRVMMNEDELTDLDAPLEISEGAAFTFIRLTFLAGSIW